MTAVKRDLYIEQGATYSISFTWYSGDDPDNPGPPIDLTGANARMQIRKTLTSSTPLLSLVSADVGPVAARIALGGVAGTVVITMTDEDTMLLTSKSAVYDLEIELPTNSPVTPFDDPVYRILQGKVTVDLNVTRTGA